ncbi:hypothetical protein FSP39_019581, partial [Pinctada imbricata]
VLTVDGGFTYANVNMNATLEWRYLVKDSNFTVYNPEGRIILEVQNDNLTYSDDRVVYLDSSRGQGASLSLLHVTGRDNGTYVYNTSENDKDGLTLVVLEKLDPPSFNQINVTKPGHSNLVSGSVRCFAVPKGAGPYFYQPNIQTNWIYPTQDVGYNIMIKKDVAYIKNVNCAVNASQPIFCQAREGLGPYSERSHFFPHYLYDFLDTDSDIDRYISNITRGEDRTDWSQIANVYAQGDNPPISVARPRWEQNGRPSMPAMPVINLALDDTSSETEGESNTESTNPTTPSQLDENLNVPGAEGVDRNAIIKEVEICLRNLTKSLSHIQQQVEITRENLVDNLLNIYSDPCIVEGSLHIKIIGEEGSDWGGVSRDVFTSFWSEVSLTYFLGDLVHVPYLPPHRLEEMYKFRLMGRILSHSTAVLGYIPMAICKSTMMVTIIDATEIAEDVLLEDFLLYLDNEDRTLLQSAMDHFQDLSEDELDKVQNIFVKFDMGCVLQEETLHKQILKMAQNELVIKPRSLCEKMREGIPEVHYAQFWSQMSLDHLTVLYDRLKPTPNKVLACLRSETLFLTESRRRVYGYFKDFIRTLTERELEILLQFITGQACVPKRLITVQFSQLSGAERRPIAHTCSFSIELPETYENYEDFEAEFRILLTSDILRFDTQ